MRNEIPDNQSCVLLGASLKPTSVPESLEQREPSTRLPLPLKISANAEAHALCSRPRNVNDVASQEEVVKTLRNSLETGNLPHLLFYGPPGTGKTTTALAIARQLFGCAHVSVRTSIEWGALMVCVQFNLVGACMFRSNLTGF